MPVNDTAETKTSGQWPFMGAMKKFSLLSKIRGWGWWQTAQPCWQAAFERWSFSFSWRQYVTISHSPLCKVAAASSCYFGISQGPGTHLISQAYPSPPATQHLPTTLFNRVAVIRGHWITLSTTSLQAVAKHPTHRSVVHIKKFLPICVHFCCLIQAMLHVLVTPVLAQSSKRIFAFTIKGRLYSTAFTFTVFVLHVWWEREWRVGLSVSKDPWHWGKSEGSPTRIVCVILG